VASKLLTTEGQGKTLSPDVPAAVSSEVQPNGLSRDRCILPSVITAVLLCFSLLTGINERAVPSSSDPDRQLSHR
jgi:hypothetical protein